MVFQLTFRSGKVAAANSRGEGVRAGRLGPKVGPSPPLYEGEAFTPTAPGMNSSSWGSVEPSAAPDCADVVAGLEGKGRNKNWDQCL